MKNFYLCIIISNLFFLSNSLQKSYAQSVAINTDGSSADSSAMLDIKNLNKGLLIPRVALTSTTLATPITSPAISLLMYNTANVNDVTPGYYYWSGSTWLRLSPGSGSNIPNGSAAGQMLYWNGTAWIVVAAGSPGQYLQFSQSGIPNWTGVLFANLTTSVISSTTYYASAVSGGNITNDGGSAIIARGVCWNTTVNPTITDNKSNDGTGAGSYGSTLTGLSPSTTYYIRAYATNAAGPSYGNQISFTTVPSNLATLTTAAASNVTGGTANSGETVTSENGSPVTARGICWSTSINPTIADTKSLDGSGLGTSVAYMNGLSTSTTYYIRGYATNSAGTAYGNQQSLTTTSTLTIGGGYQGGIVAYIYQVGDPGYVAGQTHGLIATPADQASNITWCNNPVNGSTATALGTGNANTVNIYVNDNFGNSAGTICYNLVSGGYTDWFLPSKDELNKLYLSKTAIGGFDISAFYWSSSLNSSPGQFNAWRQNFNSGNQSFTLSSYNSVRAVRYF